MTILIDTAPTIDLAIQDITHLVEALRDYHGLYSPLFQRREQRQAAHTYSKGCCRSCLASRLSRW